MKTSFTFLMIFSLLVCPVTAVDEIKAVTKGDLEINFSKLRNDKGQVYFLVFDSDKGFPDVLKETVFIGTMKIKNGKTSTTLKNLPYGNYAVCAIHDENSNKKMDMNLIRLPKEGYGFSKKLKFKLRAPKFNEVSIPLASQKRIINISMKYL